MDKWLKGLIAGLAAMVANIHPVIIGFVILMGLDIISGIVRAGRAKDLSSDRSYLGMRKKASMLILVGVAAVVQHYIMPGQLPFDLTVGTAGAFAFTEAISIIENAKACGVSIPSMLFDALQKREK